MVSNTLSQRFKQIGGSSQKIDTFVEFPEELNMSPYMTSSLLKYIHALCTSIYSQLTVLTQITEWARRRASRRLSTVRSRQPHWQHRQWSLHVLHTALRPLVLGWRQLHRASARRKCTAQRRLSLVLYEDRRINNTRHYIGGIIGEYEIVYISICKRNVLIYKIRYTTTTSSPYCLPFFKRGFKEFSRICSLIMRHISDCCNRSGTLSVSVK